jgi:hypothetical protein
MALERSPLFFEEKEIECGNPREADHSGHTIPFYIVPIKMGMNRVFG